MALMAANVALKAKLQLKGAHKPWKVVRGKMPDGAGLLASTPRRRTTQGDEAAADEEYCHAIRQVAGVFGQQKRAQSTADEHKMYIRLLDGWLVREGFGSYVTVVLDGSGQVVSVRARLRPDGTKKVMRAEMLIGHLLQMAEGSRETPKGGHAGDLLARAGQEVATACGPRSKMKRKAGKFGSGPYKDEPWSLQAYQKRVYAVRAQHRERTCMHASSVCGRGAGDWSIGHDHWVCGN